MILDSIIVAIAVFLELLACLFAALINLFILIIELIIKVFRKDFSMNKVPAKKFRKRNDTAEEISEEVEPQKISGMWIIITLIIVLLFWGVPKIFNKEIQFLATDGNSLPFAEIIITTEDDVTKKRTDITGKIDVPRFGLVSLKINDPRYAKQTWLKKDITSTLSVNRSLIGSGLDKLSDLIKKEK